mgnify:CR=1 FL=1|jgi:glycosyltransferase involved in cell wall biosynthesis
MYFGTDVFVNPSREETFSMATAETQACGTPTVVFKGTACEEILDKSNGIVVPDDALKLKGAFFKLRGGD